MPGAPVAEAVFADLAAAHREAARSRAHARARHHARRRRRRERGLRRHEDAEGRGARLDVAARPPARGRDAGRRGRRDPPDQRRPGASTRSSCSTPRRRRSTSTPRCMEVDPDKDVDGMHPVNLGRLALSMPGPVPCTPAGIEALLAHYEIPVAGRDVCVLGRGATLGRPLALLLSQKRPTANAAVTVVHTGVPDWPKLHAAGRHRRGRGGRARHPAARAHHARRAWWSAAACATRARSCCPTSTSAARRSPAGSRRASAASARPPSRCCSATPSKRPSGASAAGVTA